MNSSKTSDSRADLLLGTAVLLLSLAAFGSSISLRVTDAMLPSVHGMNDTATVAARDGNGKIRWQDGNHKRLTGQRQELLPVFSSGALVALANMGASSRPSSNSRHIGTARNN